MESQSHGRTEERVLPRLVSGKGIIQGCVAGHRTVSRQGESVTELCQVGWGVRESGGWWAPSLPCCVFLRLKLYQPAEDQGCHRDPVTLPRVGLSHSHPGIKGTLPSTGTPCLFPQLPDDLVLYLCAFFVPSQPLVHPTPAVLEGKGSDLPFQTVAPGPHAGGSLARSPLPVRPYSVTLGDHKGQGHGCSFVLPASLSRVPPGAGPDSHMLLSGKTIWVYSDYNW